MENLPNFREICVKNYNDDEKLPRGLLYRSSRPDFLTDTEVCELQRLGIRSVLDFRSPKEYAKADGLKLLDGISALYTVKIPHREKYRPQEVVKCKLVTRKNKRQKKPLEAEVSSKDVKVEKVTDIKITGESNDIQLKEVPNEDEVGSETEGSEVEEAEFNPDTSSMDKESLEKSQANSSSPPPIKHYLIDFFTGRFIWSVFRRAPWYIQLYAFFWLLIDFILRTGYLYFVQTFAKYVLNRNGILHQYMDIVDLSQRSICAALKLLSDSENIPALINCAHGKDRTGIVTALVMHCLGKSREEIAEEYSRSEAGLLPVKERLYKEMVGRYHFSEQFMTAEAATMLKLLDYLSEKYGSVSNYLEYIGFSSIEQERLRRNLLCTDL
ncbi:uncharacterized protein LOC135476212 [Liolophura sinensis]|uniref:uncharacterized protein LOC135476212 n=1 Tax=Liolophura sinensis TaxID=3198878 RepID=UPI003158B4CD